MLKGNQKKSNLEDLDLKKISKIIFQKPVVKKDAIKAPVIAPKAKVKTEILKIEVFEIAKFIDTFSLPKNQLTMILGEIEDSSYNFNKKNCFSDELYGLLDFFEKKSDKIIPTTTRSCIVCLQGHIDHGKTTLVQELTGLNIVEYGNITQEISFYKVKCKKDVYILDTPGHSFFHDARSKVAYIVDCVIIVCSAVDGVQAETVKIIDCINKNKHIIVVITKIDKATDEKSKDVADEIVYMIEGKGASVQKVFYVSNKQPETIQAIAVFLNELSVTVNLVSYTLGYIMYSISFKNQKILVCLIKKGTLQKGSFLLTENSLFKVASILNYKREFVLSSSDLCYITLKNVSGNDTVNLCSFFIAHKDEAILKAFMVEQVVATNTVEQKERPINIIFQVSQTNISDSLKQLCLTLGYIKPILIAVEISETVVELAKLYDAKSNCYIVSYQTNLNKEVLKKVNLYKIQSFTIQTIYDLELLLKNLIKEYVLKLAHCEVIKIFKVTNSVVFGCKCHGILRVGDPVMILRSEKHILKLLYTTNIQSIKCKQDFVENTQLDNNYGFLFSSNTSAVEVGDLVVPYNDVFNLK